MKEADLEKRVKLLEKALVEQSKVLSSLASDVKKSFQHMEMATNSSISQLWQNQQNQSAMIYSVLNALDPEEYPEENAPHQLKEETNAESNDKTPH